MKLSLDSPQWGELRHAYGFATDTPGLLRMLHDLPSSGGKAEPWHTLWSSLAHQGDVHPASLAAVPHVVDILGAHPERACFDFFLFPAWIEICRAQRGLAVPAGLADAYWSSLNAMPELVARAAGRDWDERFLRCALAALAVSKGHHEVGAVLLELDPQVATEFLGWVKSR